MIVLEHNTWDDDGYRTLYRVTYLQPDGARMEIGSVKIGQFDMPSTDDGRHVATKLPVGTFNELDDDRFFSLGQDSTYYENLRTINSLRPGFFNAYLDAMVDIAYLPELLDRVLRFPVTQKSLLRTVTVGTVRNQFARVIRGGAAIEAYNLVFPIRDQPGATKLEVAVNPAAQPPQNLRILIGRNGAGKSRTLHQINEMLIRGSHHYEALISAQRSKLANLVWVSFSAFDALYPIPSADGRKGLVHHYVGLKTDPDSHHQQAGEPELLSPAELDNTAIRSVWSCINVEGLRQRLIAFLERLNEGDPNFEDTGLSGIVAECNPMDDVPLSLMTGIADLSSGHKIAVLTAARLVESVAEKTLVLIDEPESHLHPPLLAALMRAISDLLSDRNGVAIVVTHSPVVLQEVPRSCVYIVDSIGNRTTITPPTIETFGENVGTLTREVFGYEVQRTGFASLLRELSSQTVDYHEALQVLDGQLGAEGRAILRTLMANKDSGSGNVGR